MSIPYDDLMSLVFSSSIWACQIWNLKYRIFVFIWFFQARLPEENNTNIRNSTRPNQWATKDISDESLSVVSDDNKNFNVENRNVENQIGGKSKILKRKSKIKEKSSRNYLSDESLSELSDKDLNGENLSKKGKW